MAQSERRVMSLPKLLEEENRRREVEGKPPKKIRIVSIGGPNMSGKSRIVQGLEALFPMAYDIGYRQWGNNTEQDAQTDLAGCWTTNFFREPTPNFPIGNQFLFEELPDDEIDSYRASVMRSGSNRTVLDTFALFTQGRRRIQEWLTKHPATQNQLCILDRSSEATLVHQILLNPEPTTAQYLEETLRELHKNGYFLPYQQTFLVLPDKMKLRDSDDDPHTNPGELEAYKKIIHEGMLKDYCQQTLWVENDPKGEKNCLALPTFSIAAAVYACQVFGTLQTGVEYQLFSPLLSACKWLGANRYYEFASYRFSDLMKMLKDKWVETGNIAVRLESSDQTILLKISDRMP